MTDELFERLDTAGLADALDYLLTDHRHGAGPFDGLEPPEQRELDQVARPEDRLRFLVFGCALDYARPADRHWEQMGYLYDQMHWAFDPATVIRLEPEVLGMSFGSLGIRFWNNDSETWYTIAESLMFRTDGWVTDLLEYCDYNARELYDYLQADDTEPYPYLGGDKIAPMFCRMVDEYVYALDDVGDLPLPVDVQVERVTLAMVPELADAYPREERRLDAIRDLWTQMADEHDVALYRLDEAIWQLGRYWDDWGQEYLDIALTVADADIELVDPDAELTDRRVET